MAWAGAPASVAFQVWRNNQQIGEHAVRVSGAGGDVTAVIDAHFVVSIGPIPVFHYHHAATEVWRDGRFASLDAHTVSNGRVETVRATRQPDGVAIAVGSKAPVMAAANASPLTHWNMKALAGPMFNPQTGKLMPREQVQPLGSRPVTLAGGRVIDARAFALTGEAQITDWYDASDAWTGLRAKVMDGSFVDYRRI
jgi:hypothetical protein